MTELSHISFHLYSQIPEIFIIPKTNVRIRTRLEGGVENGGRPGAQPGAARWHSTALPAESEQKNVEAVRNSEGVSS